MAVRLPSDLIADVMQSADPVRRSAASAKLRSAGEIAGAQFASTFESVQAPSASPMEAFEAPAPVRWPHASSEMVQDRGIQESAFQGFERLVLRSLFEALLPGEESGSFGEGPSAGVWRSMAADQLAGVYSERGGIGIANLLTDGASPLRREGQWPYFSKDAISTFKG
jgi:hypothetical protein